MFDDDIFPLTVFLKPARIAGQYITIKFCCVNHTVNLKKFCQKLSSITSKAFGGKEKTLKVGTFHHFGKIHDPKSIDEWKQIQTVLQILFGAEIKKVRNHYYNNPTEFTITFNNVEDIQKYIDIMSSDPLKTYSHLSLASKFDLI